MKTKLAYLFLLPLVLMVFSSCFSTNDDAPTPEADEAGLKVMNATADTMNYYVNGTRQNLTSSIYPGGSTTYSAVIAGAQNYQFKRNGTSEALFSAPLTLDSGLVYSLFVTGRSADRLILINDVFKPETGNFASIRFVHTSPGIGNIDVTVGDTVAFRGVAYKAHSAFTKVGSGQKKLRVYAGGAATPQISGTITVLPGRVYTLFTKGAVNGTGQNAFSAVLVGNQ